MNRCCLPSVLLLLVVSVLWIIVESTKNSVTVTSSSPYGTFLVVTFGMVQGSIINLSYKITATHPNHPYTGYFLFLVVTEKERRSWYYPLNTVINMEKDLSASVVNSLCNAPSAYRIYIDASYNNSTTSTSDNNIVKKGEWTGIFDPFSTTISSPSSSNISIIRVGGTDGERFSTILLSCRPGVASNPLTATFAVEMKNPHPYSSSSYSQQSIESAMLYRVYQGCCIIFALLWSGLVGQLYISRYQVKNIHFLFFVTLTVWFSSILALFSCKCILSDIIMLSQKLHYIETIFFIDYYEAETNGEISDSTNLAVNVLNALNKTLSLLSLLLLSFGNSHSPFNYDFKQSFSIFRNIFVSCFRLDLNTITVNHK